MRKRFSDGVGVNGTSCVPYVVVERGNDDEGGIEIPPLRTLYPGGQDGIAVFIEFVEWHFTIPSLQLEPH